MGCYVVWGTTLLTELLIVLTTLVLPLGPAAQRPGHVPRIAFLALNFPSAPSGPTRLLEAFRHRVRERGWVQGHLIASEWRWAEGSAEGFAALVAEVAGLQVEVLVGPNSRAAWVAKRASSTFPLVVLGAR